MSVPNQKTIIVQPRTERNSNNIYATFNIEALQEAMKNLKNSSFKLWCYINKNQDKYKLELSQKACEEWGIKKDSYYSSVRDLTEKGYLIQKDTHSNIYSFYEVPFSENPKNIIDDNVLPFSEKQNTNSEKQKTPSNNQNGVSEKTQRNNTNNTQITQDNTKEKKANNLDDYCRLMLQEMDEYMTNNPQTKEQDFETTLLSEWLIDEKAAYTETTEVLRENLEHTYYKIFPNIKMDNQTF